mmetsp:Transcript_10795/g.33059  ORF Transcript_10795/g.33059 Transcript_10795/m.33059 type:complete len:202 (+) Transcript_10795:1332-1937(+)
MQVTYRLHVGMRPRKNGFAIKQQLLKQHLQQRYCEESLRNLQQQLKKGQYSPSARELQCVGMMLWYLQSIHSDEHDHLMTSNLAKEIAVALDGTDFDEYTTFTCPVCTAIVNPLAATCEGVQNRVAETGDLLQHSITWSSVTFLPLHDFLPCRCRGCGAQKEMSIDKESEFHWLPRYIACYFCLSPFMSRHSDLIRKTPFR